MKVYDELSDTKLMFMSVIDVVEGILQSQRSLAEITEMIHMGYLIHSGVVDMRNLPSNEDPTTDKALNYGNKVSILGGDFLLANASTELAKLHNTKVISKLMKW